VISWPVSIEDAGGLRTQFHHVSDIMPTILEAAHIAAPAMLDGVPQLPLDGVGMSYTFDQPASASRRTTQVFEMFENLGLYHDGWMACTQPVGTAWDADKNRTLDLDSRTWELYDLRTDFSQARNVATTYPAKLAQMRELFWAEAARNNILPIHGPMQGREGMPSLTDGRTTFTYPAGIVRVPENSAPHTMGRSFAIAAEVTIPQGGAEGVLVAQGGRFGGYAFYIHDGQVVFHYNAIDPRRYSIRTSRKLIAGAHQLVMQFDIDPGTRPRGGTVSILIDGEQAARGRVDQMLTQWLSHSEGFDVGSDTLTPVSDDYTVERSSFSGGLKKLTVVLK
jgi:hypothetical protein